MDLLFEDVIRYMVEHEDEKLHLMSLEQLLNRIRHKEGKMREDLHEMYSYTDAQVFSKMRKLHEELDEKEKENKAKDKDEESYINDCIKTIMDGQIPEPVFPTCQRVIDLKIEKGYKNIIQRESDEIANEIAQRLGIYRERIKVNVVDQELMKYKKRMEVEDGTERESNREAIRIIYEKPGEGDGIKAAAESNATILSGLSDKALLIFNVYYVAPKSERKEVVDANRKAIEEAFSQFLTEKFKS
jgi:vacuolar-type H+-ATPase subunit I/STV1